MKRPGFLQGVILAAIVGFFASAVVATLSPFFGLGAALRIVIATTGLAYTLYLLSRSTERVGRVTTIAGWGVLAIATWWSAPPLPLFMMIHVGAIWLVRSLYFHSSLIPALLDLGLGALGVCASVWAIRRSGSVFLASWCFFLVQALFVAIPSVIRRKRDTHRGINAESERFERARRQADEALRHLFTH